MKVQLVIEISNSYLISAPIPQIQQQLYIIKNSTKLFDPNSILIHFPVSTTTGVHCSCIIRLSDIDRTLMFSDESKTHQYCTYLKTVIIVTCSFTLK